MIVRHMRAALIETVIKEGTLTGIAALPAQFDTDPDVFGRISHGVAPLWQTKPYLPPAAMKLHTLFSRK
jgi:hypothetical protein